MRGRRARPGPAHIAAQQSRTGGTWPGLQGEGWPGPGGEQWGGGGGDQPVPRRSETSLIGPPSAGSARMRTPRPPPVLQRRAPAKQEF